jgi:hypothetical protein
VFDLAPIIQAVMPTVIGLVAAQRIPDEIVPIKANPNTIPERMTVIGAAVVILTALEAFQNNRPDQIDLVQFVSALGAVWVALPRAHQIFDVIAAPFKKKED